jgi:hypothetical protein
MTHAAATASGILGPEKTFHQDPLFTSYFCVSSLYTMISKFWVATSLLVGLSLADVPVDKALKPCGDAWYLSEQVEISQYPSIIHIIGLILNSTLAMTVAFSALSSVALLPCGVVEIATLLMSTGISDSIFRPSSN